MNHDTLRPITHKGSTPLFKEAFLCLKEALFILFRVELPRKWDAFKDRWLGPLVEYEPGQAQQGPVAVNWWHVAFLFAMGLLAWGGAWILSFVKG